MSALNTSGGTIAVVLAGTAVSLPDDQNLSTFTVDGTDTVFTVPETGTYLVSYKVATTAALLLTSSVLRNGTAIPGSEFSPAVSASFFLNTFITDLTAGDQLQLQLSGLLGAAVLQDGAGATLTVVRLN